MSILIDSTDNKRWTNLPYHTNEDQEEISKIASKLDPDEKVAIVAKGGSKRTFLTDRRLIIRKPSILGRETVEDIAYHKITSVQLKKGIRSSSVIIRASGYSGNVDSIEKDMAEKIVEYIKQAMKNPKKTFSSFSGDSYAETSLSHQQQQSSIADELTKLAKLKEQGILSEAEFLQMKQDILKRM